MNTAHQPHTPELTPALFADLLDPSKSPFDICHTHNLALDKLHAITTGAHFRACVQMLEEIHAERTAAQRPQRERLALDALDRIVTQTPTTNTHTETIRRAASALIRHKPHTPVQDGADQHREDGNHTPDTAHHEQPNQPEPLDPCAQTAPSASEEMATNPAPQTTLTPHPRHTLEE
ncbi:MAG: hypothetical protein D6692_04475, partial [Planctomycetota bacterium]